MPWVRLDEEFARHPKVVAAGPLGMAMQVAALCYCNTYLTDGFVPRSVVSGLLDLEGLGMRMWAGELVGGGEDATWKLVVEDLLEVELWDEVPGGYRIHDYHDYQPSKEQVLKEREQKKRAGQKGGKASAQARASARGQAAAQAPARAQAQAESKPVPVPVPPLVVTSSPPVTEADARASNSGGLEDLVSQVRAVRPHWSPQHIADAARRCADAGRSYDATLSALLAVADDPTTIRPGRVVDDGPWWRPPTERVGRSTTDDRVGAGLALAEQLEATERRAEIRALPGGMA